MEKFLELSKQIHKNRTVESKYVFEIPLKIKKNTLIIDVIFYIFININSNHRLFKLISKNIMDIDRHYLILYSQYENFENLPKFIKDADNENINSLAIFIQYCYNMIDELDFDLVNSIFVKNNINYLSMKAFNDEDKIYFTEKCNNCNKYTNTKTKCGHNLCYQCILNIDECPICKQDTKLKILKRKKHIISYY